MRGLPPGRSDPLCDRPKRHCPRGALVPEDCRGPELSQASFAQRRQPPVRTGSPAPGLLCGEEGLLLVQETEAHSNKAVPLLRDG